ncbi:MAG: hypothetical protein IKV13_00635 [Akkermansia sp.]|nr:hypothetical protein [Akkermansia sp.]
MKKKILFIMHLPPPVHGQSMVCQQIKDSADINQAFECRYVNLSASRSADEVGHYGALQTVKKLWRFAGSFLNTFWQLLAFRPSTGYLTITCHGIPFLKDAPFVMLCKLFRCRIILHQHSKGMSTCAHKAPYRWLLPLIYRNTTVVLLSWRLYDDVAAVVKREQVEICPNGL